MSDRQPPHRPVPESERIFALDALRGVALLGIFFVNMQYFSMPLMKAIGFVGLVDAAPGERVAWACVKLLCEYKFISLFSLLFGAGMIMQLQRAATARRSFIPLYLRRMAVLAGFGLAHGLLLWYGDILFIYAILGTSLLLFRNLRPRTLLIVAGALMIVNTMLVTGGTWLQSELEPPPAETVAGAEPDEAPAEQTPPRPMEAMADAQFNPGEQPWIDAELRAYRDGPLADAMTFRGVSFAFMIVAATFGYGWRVLAMFLIGAAMMRGGFFRPAARRAQIVIAVVGIAIGLLAEAGAVSAIWRAEFALGNLFVGGVFLHEIGGFGLCLGYTGLITLVCSSGPGRVLLAPLAQTGRVALSVYLLETITATALMYWWGAGWFGSVGRPRQILIVAIVYAALTIAATIWLRLFRMGPFEWLWRSITYARPQPIRRHRQLD